MTEPITLPPELVQRLLARFHNGDTLEATWAIAAQWGADQELEACCLLLDSPDGTSLRNARRPRPPSLKEQALTALDEMSIEPCLINGVDANASVRAKYTTIRCALEALPND
jgi:hypothetical protein